MDAKALEILSPSPSPPNCRQLNDSNDRNIFGRNSGSIPMPVSVMLTNTVSSPSEEDESEEGEGFEVWMVIVPPVGVNLIAFLRMFQKICCSLHESPLTI